MNGLLLLTATLLAAARPCGEVDLEGLEAPTRTALERGIAQFRADSGSADAAGDLARLLHASGLTAAAAPCYEYAGLLAPGEARWAYLAGVVAEAEGNLTDSVPAYWAALRAAPDYLPAALRLAAALRAEGRVEAADLVLARFRKAGTGGGEAGDHAAPALEAALGEQALAAGRPHEAAERFRRALAARPDADRLNYLLGRALQALGDDAGAREALARRGTVGLMPDDPWLAEVDALQVGATASLLLGRRAFQAGRYEAARQAFETALAREPGSVAARVNLATTLERLGDRERARALFTSVLAQAPDNRAVLYNLAALDERTDPGLAAEGYRRFLALEPEDAEAWYRLGRSLAASGEVDEALAALDRSRGDLARYVPATLRMAELLVANDRERAAAELMEEARSVAPREPELVAALLTLWTTAGDRGARDGTAALALALELHEALGTSESARLVALAQGEVGDCEAARRWLATAAALEPDEGRRALLERARATLRDPCRPGGS